MMETAGATVVDEEAREAMKDCGIGTPATRASILERLVSVGYVVRTRHRFACVSDAFLLCGLKYARTALVLSYQS